MSTSCTPRCPTWRHVQDAARQARATAIHTRRHPCARRRLCGTFCCACRPPPRGLGGFPGETGHAQHCLGAQACPSSLPASLLSRTLPGTVPWQRLPRLLTPSRAGLGLRGPLSAVTICRLVLTHHTPGSPTTAQLCGGVGVAKNSVTHCDSSYGPLCGAQPPDPISPWSTRSAPSRPSPG